MLQKISTSYKNEMKISYLKNSILYTVFTVFLIK